VILYEDWTHAGIGVSEYRGKICAVVLFIMKPFRDVLISRLDKGFSIRLIPEKTVKEKPVVIYNNTLIPVENPYRIVIDTEGFVNIIQAGIQKGDSLIITDLLFLEE